MKVGASTDVGKHRKINQDSYFVSKNEDLPLFIVSDGMGGHKAGEVASKMAVDIIKEEFLQKIKGKKFLSSSIADFIKSAIETANLKIYKLAQKKEEYLGMGTTVTMIFILGNEIFIGQIGDSRAYLLRKDKLVQLTEDHSLVAELVKKGDITEEEALNHPQKNVITRAVGTDKEVDVDIVVEKLHKKDTILLCTDGLTNMVDNREIKDILLEERDVQTACDELVKTANNNGGLDNITVLAVKIV